MGSDVSPDRLRALLIPDPRVKMDNVWSAGSTYTQSGLRAGVPTKVSTADSNLVLNATGTVHTGQAGKDLRIKCQRSGMPGESTKRAGFIWKNDGDADYRGWDAPNIITGWESITWASPTFTLSDFHAIALPDSTVVVAFSRLQAAAGSARVRKRSATTGTWASGVVVASDGIKTTNNPNPCLLLLPSGRILCFLWDRDSVNDLANIQVFFSDDEADTWTRVTRRALANDIRITTTTGSGASGYAVGRLRAAYHNGAICLVSELKQNDTDPDYRDVFGQWVSTDLGATFTAVGSAWDGDNSNDGGGKYHEILSIGSSLFMFYTDSGVQYMRQRQIGSAFDEFGSATIGGSAVGIGYATRSSTPGAELSAGQLGVCADFDGRIYATGISTLAAGQLGVVASYDRGASFDPLSGGIVGLGAAAGKYWYTQDPAYAYSTSPGEITMAPSAGRLVCVHNLISTAAIDDSMVATYLGGYSSVTMPPWGPFQIGFTATYLPFDLPADVGWGKAFTGAATESVAAASLDLPAVGASSSIYYTRDGITTDADDVEAGIILKTALQVNAGSSYSDDFIAVRIRVADGTNDYDASIRFVTTGFVVYDNETGSAVGSFEGVTTTAGIEVVVAIAGSALKSWYRTNSTTPDRTWADGPAGTLTTAASAAANSMIQFGRIAAHASADAEWYSVQYSGTDGDNTGYPDRRLTDLTFPDDLNPREYSPDPAPITGGIDISAIDGPAFAGDEFSVQSRYQYEVSRAVVGSDDPPSPRVRWRSTDETEHTIAFGLTADPTTDEAYPFCDAIGVALLGINFKTATLQGYDVGTTAWVDLVAMDASSGMSALNWTRKGDTVRPTSASSHTAEPFFDAAELVGGTFALDGDKRKIVSNSGGAWSGSHSSRQITNVQVTLTGSEGASGTSGAIWAPQLAGTIPLLGATYSAYRIKIGAAQGTVEGYYEIGAIVIGPLFLFADSYAWGRSIETTANTELTEDRDWTTHSRVLGPARRVVEFGWTDPVDEFAYGATSPNPDYIKTTTTAGSLPSGSKGATIRQMEGYLRQLDGADTPVVYFPEIVKSTLQADDDRVYNRRDQFVYGRIVSKVRRDTVMGTEGVDELVRLTKVTIQEEI